jgi:quercetin dioxygenase-like cupin family protein
LQPDDSKTAGRATEPLVRKADDVAALEVAAGTAARMQVLLGPDDRIGGFAMRRFRMGEGGGMPRHTNSVQHQQFVLRGRARVGIGDRVHEVSAQSVLYIPAGVPHYYEVLEAPFEFLCVVPDAPDRIRVLEDDERK